MKVISLFSGIGGFELAAEWMGWTPVVSCEINPFGRKVLEHYWPQAYHHTDIKTLTYEKINEELTQRFGPCWRSDDIILTGGFPCQPYSMAGKRLGKEDDRHLWPEMLRIIREVQPKWIVGENVFGLVNWNGGLIFHEVQTDLEAQGYEVQPYVLPACAVNAPHRRDRVWFVAYRDRKWSGQKHELCTRGDLPEKWVDKCRIATNTDSCRYRGLAETPGNHNAESIRWMDKNCGQNRNEIRCEIDGCGWSSPHPNNTRNTASPSGNIKNGSKNSNQRQHSFNEYNRHGNKGDAPHPNSNPTRTPGESASIEGIGSNINVQQSERGSKTELNNRSSSVSQPAADAENARSGKLPNQPPQPTSGHPTNKNHHSAPDEITPNTSSSRRENRLHGTSTNEQQKTNQLRNTNTKQPPNWSNFPTVSPLCSRNDGPSYKLDSITFSKWRNESIKAAGNAIVPQVALQIFKAIQAYQQ